MSIGNFSSGVVAVEEARGEGFQAILPSAHGAQTQHDASLKNRGKTVTVTVETPSVGCALMHSCMYTSHDYQEYTLVVGDLPFQQ